MRFSLIPTTKKFHTLSLNVTSVEPESRHFPIQNRSEIICCWSNETFQGSGEIVPTLEQIVFGLGEVVPTLKQIVFGLGEVVPTLEQIVFGLGEVEASSQRYQKPLGFFKPLARRSDL